MNSNKLRQLVMTKAKNYSQTNAVRSLKSSTINNRAPKHYGIKKGTPLKEANLISLILYTDYTELSGSFSASFRKTTPYERLSQVKKRNSHYFWWGKILRETVELFGESAQEMVVCYFKKVTFQIWYFRLKPHYRRKIPAVSILQMVLFC